MSYGSDLKASVGGMFNLWQGVKMQAQFMFEDPSDPTMNIQNIVLTKGFRDSNVSLLYQGQHGHGMYTAAYMQSITKNL